MCRAQSTEIQADSQASEYAERERKRESGFFVGRWERKSNRKRIGDGEREMMNEWYGVSTGGKNELGQSMHSACIITRAVRALPSAAAQPA